MLARFLSLLVLFGTFFSSNASADLFGSAKAIPVNEAIQYTVEERGDELLIHWKLADTVYLYRDKLKLYYPDKSKYEAFKFEDIPEVIEDPSFGSVSVFYESATTVIDRTKLKSGTTELTLKYQGCHEAMGLCYPPQKTPLPITPTTASAPSDSSTSASTEDNLNSATGINSFLQNASTLLVIATFLLLGIGLTFTPCVLPMVPILSSVIAGQKNLTPLKGFTMSLAYVLGMAITFALAGVLVGIMGARFNIQIYMQQPWVLGIFAALFVLLALAMFGFYELRLPRFIQDPLDRLNQKQKGGNLISVFLMGALSAVVVSPCVSAPLAGALVYISTTGDAALGGFALFALGMGMGLPLIAIGTTGASFLPKAGMWMDQVKGFFGVLLLAVALWILGRVLPEDIYLTAWVILIGVYSVILGAFEPATNTKQRVIKGLALLSFAFSIILMAKVIGLSGNTQPQFTSNPNAPTNNVATASPSASQDGIFTTITDEATLNEYLKTAESNQKIVFLDVYADWCIECKIMSNTIFADPEVIQALEPFEKVKFDITEFNDFHKKYLEDHGVFGPPALLFYGLNGVEIKDAQILGEISKADFLNHLDQFDHVSM